METAQRDRRAQLSPASQSPSSMRQHTANLSWTLQSDQMPTEYHQSDPSRCHVGRFSQKSLAPNS